MNKSTMSKKNLSKVYYDNKNKLMIYLKKKKIKKTNNKKNLTGDQKLKHTKISHNLIFFLTIHVL